MINTMKRAVQVFAGEQKPTEPPETAYRPFFISGHPRSGTNWLSNICNLHPDIACDGEFHFSLLFEGFDKFTDKGKSWYLATSPHLLPVVNEQMDGFVRRTLIAMGKNRKPGALVVGDHSPRPFRLFIPNASHLVMLRDGRDVIVSWTFHLLRIWRPDIVHEQTRVMFETLLNEAGNDPEKVKQAGRTLLRDQEWVSRLACGWALQMQNDLPRIRQLMSSPEMNCRVLLLQYEKMHADVESWRAEVYRFLGVDPSKAAPPSRETNTLAGFGREDPGSFFRKGEPQDWKNYFDENTTAWFKHCAGKELIDAGYETDLNW